MVKVVIRQDDGKERVVGRYDPATQSLLLHETLQTFHAEVERLGIGRESFRGLKDKGLQYVVLNERRNRKYRATVQAFCDYGKYLYRHIGCR